MDKEQVINQYKSGEAINKIARDHGVSRQAILYALKSAGVYNTEQGGKEEIASEGVRGVSNQEGVRETLPNGTELIFLDNERPKRPIPFVGTRIEENIHADNPEDIQWYQYGLYTNKHWIYTYSRNQTTTHNFRLTHKPNYRKRSK